MDTQKLTDAARALVAGDKDLLTVDVLLLPAVVGACLCRPQGAISLLEISLPEGI